MIIKVHIKINEKTKTDFSLRHILADTIEERKIGKVIEEGTSADGFHVLVSFNDKSTIKKNEIFSLVQSLGLGKAMILNMG
ncbi:hypothetical protein [uncultured Psychroserpens sp.]|uniref:hypothetical protein n=1 Tax=uncultured Psychroserpens sp. TaxID=255436 RepID=UPI0026284B91|nr:hypothetical protein [uncultured Psychroserpens sp.]